MNTFMIIADKAIVGKIRTSKFEQVVQCLPVIAPQWNKVEILQHDTETKTWNYVLSMTKDMDTELDPRAKRLHDRDISVTALQGC